MPNSGIHFGTFYFGLLRFASALWIDGVNQMSRPTEVHYVSDVAGNPVGVIVPIDL
jgi:hypothetical protein